MDYIHIMEGNATKGSGPELSLERQRRRHAEGVGDLELVTESLINLNEYIRGRPSNRREVLGSAFFSLIRFQAIQLRRILSLSPHPPIGSVTEPFSLSDIFSPTVLARSLLETYLNFFYLCIEPVEKDVRDLRFAIWDWHDHDDRLRGVGESPEHENEFREVFDARDRAKTLILALPAWTTLPDKYKGRAFEEGRAIIKPKSAIAESAGISGDYYKTIYTFLSSYSHGAPLAVSHSLALGEGSNEAQIMQWMSLSRQIDMTVWLDCYAIRDILKLYPDAEIKLHRRVRELLETWEYVMANWGRNSPGATA